MMVAEVEFAVGGFEAKGECAGGMTGGCGVAALAPAPAPAPVGPGTEETTGVGATPAVPAEDVAGGEYAATGRSRDGPDNIDETDIGFPLAGACWLA